MMVESFGERIRVAREKQGMESTALAAALGVNKSTISRWESGEIKDISISRAKAIAAALAVSPAWLVGWTDEMRPQ